MAKKLAWSCDEKDRNNCRNAHGCHCREITGLLRSREDISKLNHARAKLIERTRKVIGPSPELSKALDLLLRR